MDGDYRDADKFSSEPPSEQTQHDDQGPRMSLGGTGSEERTLANGDASVSGGAGPPQNNLYAEQVESVLSSEIGIQTLLTRLKQSVASAKEFALFLKKRSALEEEHANGLRKISRITHENVRRPEHRQGSFAASYDDITRIHERIADNGINFATSLHQMHEDLLEMATNVERGRKHWKQVGLAAEQKLIDIEAAMRKSKTKYDAVAEDYDRARTGDRQSGKIFGIKGPKSAAQHEEDLHKKVQIADSDYASKVQMCQSTRVELFTKGRPETVRNLQDLIKECDSALTLQMQKFASFSEKLLLQNGLSISPLRGQSNELGKESRSLRDAVAAIDNDRDLTQYIGSHSSKVPPKPADVKYERHPVLNPPTMGNPITMANPPPMIYPQTPRAPEPAQNFALRPGTGEMQSRQSSGGQNYGYNSPSTIHQHERSFSQGPPQTQMQPNQYNTGPLNRNAAPNTNSAIQGGPPQLSSLPFQSSAPPVSSYQQPVPNTSTPPPTVTRSGDLPPLKPVFGLTLEELFERDGSAVPMVVYQCIQAVDLYGLEVEGIYRLSGTSSHVTKLRAMFDNDASKVDFRNPENFFHDVNSVAGLLKQFFRDLPDPLFTKENYGQFIEAAKHDDDIVRRDSLHAIINGLPDPNYATLRALTLHLHRVTEAAASNRMNASNLAIVFGPTLMGANTGQNIQDAGWQVRVIDTILNNTLQIFDDD